MNFGIIDERICDKIDSELSRHVFQIHEMGTVAKNGMDRWLWDLLD